jgi:hypothetical protein
MGHLRIQQNFQRPLMGEKDVCCFGSQLAEHRVDQQTKSMDVCYFGLEQAVGLKLQQVEQVVCCFEKQFELEQQMEARSWKQRRLKIAFS